MSKALDGFQVVSQMQAKSTGRIDVIAAKMTTNSRQQRTFVTRKEKEGWKVMDVEDMIDFKAMPSFRRRR